MIPHARLHARLMHIIEEVDQMSAAIKGADYAVYHENYLIRRAAERAILIIAEAAKHITPAMRDATPEVDWAAIIGQANRLRHEHQRTDDFIVWKAVTEYFPVLRLAAHKLLQYIDTES